MAPRSRAIAYGLAAVLVAAGAICAALVGGVTGEVLAMVLVGAGLLGAVLLAFLDVGLSEDRARARGEARRRTRAGQAVEPRRRGGWPRRPRRPR